MTRPINTLFTIVSFAAVLMAHINTAPLLLEPAGNGGIYIVRPGDNLTRIVNRHSQSTLANPQAAIDELMADNPHITNPNQIFPGQPIFLRSKEALGKKLPAGTISDVNAALRTLSSARGPELSTLAKNSDAVGLVIGTAGSVTGAFEGLVKANHAALNDLISQHQAYRTSGVTREGYREFTRARSNVLQKMQSSFGPSVKTMLGGTPKQVTTLHRGRSANPTARLSASASRLSTVSKIMKGGGAALMVADVAVTAAVTKEKVCIADNRLEKNQHFVDGVGSIGGGIGGGAIGGAAGAAAVAFALGSNPAGWAVLLIVGGASVIGGYAGGKLGGSGAKRLYTEHGQGYDIVEVTKIERLCN